MSDKFYESSSFWTGVGSYYVLSWIFMFYPAYILALCVGKCFEEEGNAVVAGLVMMVIGWISLIVLQLCKQYFIVVVAYVMTAWPFLHQLIGYYYHACDSNLPFSPDIDWWIFW